MSFDPKQKGYRIGAEEAGTLVAGPLATGQTPQGHGMAGVNDQAVEANHIVTAVPISGDAVRREGDAKTPSADAEGNVRLRDPGLGVGEPGDPAYTLSATDPGAVAAPESNENLVFETRFARNGRGAPESVCPPLKAQSGETGKGDGAPMVFEAEAVASAGASVRRLTPTECERLQALPDGWTQLGETPDSRRYAALGDAVTASVGLWIGRRLIDL